MYSGYIRDFTDSFLDARQIWVVSEKDSGCIGCEIDSGLVHDGFWMGAGQNSSKFQTNDSETRLRLNAGTKQIRG